MKNRTQTYQNKCITLFSQLAKMAEISYKWFETRNWLPVTERLNQCINSINSSIFKYFNAGPYKPPPVPTPPPLSFPSRGRRGSGEWGGGVSNFIFGKISLAFQFYDPPQSFNFFFTIFCPLLIIALLPIPESMSEGHLSGAARM